MVRSFTWAASLALLASFGCNTDNDPGGVEDKTGVNDIPPGQSTSAGSGGEGGGIGGDPCTDPTDCDDGDACTVDECVQFNCRNTIPSDDNACTYDDCQDGASTYTTSKVLFSEDFSDNMAMWSLTGQWSIGPTVVSAGGLDGGNDPALDHTSSMDNGVAQTAAGALVQPTGGISETLESPAIPLAGVGQSDFYTLRFWRYLNADAPPVMTATVEARQGMSGMEIVWESTSKIIDAPPRGTGWFEVRLDVTNAVRACLADGVFPIFRWGFVKNGSAQSVGGWAIDDVSLEASKVPVDDLLCTLDSCADVNGMAVGVSTPMPAIDDGLACSTFVCDAGSFDNPTQQETAPMACMFP